MKFTLAESHKLRRDAEISFRKNVLSQAHEEVLRLLSSIQSSQRSIIKCEDRIKEIQASLVSGSHQYSPDVQGRRFDG